MTKPDGGSAFPSAKLSHMRSTFAPAGAESVYGPPEGGMTLRDYFAAQALAGLCANSFSMEAAYEEKMPPALYGATIVTLAFAAADLMLAERAKETP